LPPWLLGFFGLLFRLVRSSAILYLRASAGDDLSSSVSEEQALRRGWPEYWPD
jgi:hypothetical protein